MPQHSLWIVRECRSGLHAKPFSNGLCSATRARPALKFVGAGANPALALDECNAYTQRKLVRGIPFAVKDNIDVSGFMTTCASPLLANSDAMARSAPVVDAIVAAGPSILAAAGIPTDGATLSGTYQTIEGSAWRPLEHEKAFRQHPPRLEVCGKTNMDAFGIGGSSTHSAFGPVRHPLDASRVAGGSSGGSAAAVATGAALFALGSDTGGSVRQPAARCGVVGVRAGRGGVPRDGLVAYSPSMDSLGVLAQSVPVARAVYHAMRRASGRDALCSSGLYPPGPPAMDASGHPDGSGSTGGVDAQRLLVAVLDNAPLSRDALRLLAKTAQRVVPASVQGWRSALAAYTAIAAVEAASSLARFLVPDRVGDAPKAPTVLGAAAGTRVLLGRSIAVDHHDRFADAKQHCTRLEGQFDAVFQTADVVALPCLAASGPPPRIDGIRVRTVEEWRAVIAGDCPPDLADDALTVPASLAGLPAMSVPLPQTACGTDGPCWHESLQLVCRRGAEDKMFALAEALHSQAV